MARVRNVGDLQFLGGSQLKDSRLFDPDPIVRFGAAVVNQSAILPDDTGATWIHLRLTLDRPLPEADETACYSGGSMLGSPGNTDDLIDEWELQLPASIRHAIATLSLAVPNRDCVSYTVSPETSGHVDIEINHTFDEVRQPDRWIASLARKMSKWVKEPVSYVCKEGVVEIGDDVIVSDLHGTTILGEGTFLGVVDYDGIPEVTIRLEDDREVKGWDCWWTAKKFMA